jgi:hypothetical protein
MSSSYPIPPNDIDSNGNPIYKFPPFPKPPPGVTIIPFKDFKPSGIQRPALGFPDGIERDGLGIPTCTLKTQVDDNEHVPGHKKKKRKNKKKGVGMIGQNGQRKPWWEEWAEDEEQRVVRDIDSLVFHYQLDNLQRSEFFLDCRELPLRDRYTQAGNDFTSGRRMNADTQSIYDHVCVLYLMVHFNHSELNSSHCSLVYWAETCSRLFLVMQKNSLSNKQVPKTILIRTPICRV